MKVNNIYRWGPLLFVVPFSAIIFAFYGTFLPYGAIAVAGFAFIGLLWALLLGFIARHLMATWNQSGKSKWPCDIPVLLSIVALGLMSGAGIMYILMMIEALDEPTTTYAVLSALMRPAVPFYIIINSLMELFIVPLAVLLNWHAAPRRRGFILAGAVLFLIIRVWTYLVYAEMRLEISAGTLSAEDIEWFKETLITDYRVVPELASMIFFLFGVSAPNYQPQKPQSAAAPAIAEDPAEECI